ncbi:MAG TPA: hypothetical protein PLO89_06175 [Spirochaetota bacterium]|nr:hypothetical protein [Spirochaetota bacterium]
MEDQILDLPILFLIFNRPRETERVFEEIKKSRPKMLFVAADGPRNEEEKLKTDETREIISKIDWDCEVKTLFREKNLGCKVAVSEAISWFFQNVEYGAILEDDCLPSQSFFKYCEEILKKYKDDKRVFMVAGQKPIIYPFIRESYTFSKRAYIWGWATWKRSWSKYGLNILEDKKNLSDIKSISKIERILLNKRANDINSGKLNTWDLQLEVTQRLDGGLCVIPQKNLVSNIGFEISTHSFNKIDVLFHKMKRNDLKFPLKHTSKVKKDRFFDLSFLLMNILRIVLKKILPGKRK